MTPDSSRWLPEVYLNSIVSISVFGLNYIGRSQTPLIINALHSAILVYYHYAVD
jgi:hypothetical protein